MSEVPNKWLYAANPEAIPRCPKWGMMITDAVGYFGSKKRLAEVLGINNATLSSRQGEHGLLTGEESLRLWVFTRGAIPVRMIPETVDYDDNGKPMVAAYYPSDYSAHDDAVAELRPGSTEAQHGRFEWPRYGDYFPDRKRGLRTAKQWRWWNSSGRKQQWLNEQ